MSNTPIQEPPAQELSSSSGQTLPSRPFQPNSDPSASKRVCFYKSGDYKFSGHRMVINARTFKTFDALLDALSKKVPLPFGVRTITTPRGIHLVRALDDLHDGGSYVCSDQKRVKPLNLDEVNRRQVPWNTTRPFSAGRRKRQGLRIGQFGIRSEATNRPAKIPERVAVRTPKRLEVIKNRDPTVKRTIVLQRKTAPTFDALLDYLSQILQFPVLKLFSIDGRRVDGLAALILCSGVVVAAGNEPFRLGNYSFHRVGQMAQAMYMDTVEPSMLQPRAQNDKSFSSGRGSRNFSLSSERYIVNQINKSQHRIMNDHLHHHNGSFEAEVNHHHSSLKTCGTGVGDNGHQTCVAPQDDDIEKSFRVNQDGSMTVEMKVRLTIKEEEMLHWTTTLSRSSLSKRPVCASISESGNSSPDTNNAIAKNSSSISEDETKEENHPAEAGKGVLFNDQRVHEGYTSMALRKSGFKRTPTPGPRHVKRASVESVKTVTESGVQESTLGHYSYMERTAEGGTTEGYCVMRHSSSSSNRPIPKPRKTVSAETSNKDSHSFIRSSGVAEVLQMQNNGMEVTETVMHIYETQGCYDNYFANEDYSVDSVPLHGSTPSSSNDCDIDFSRQPPTTDSLLRQTEEMLSLSSEPITPTREITNNLSSVTEHEAQSLTISQIEERVEKDKTPKVEKKKKMIKPARNQKSSTSTSSSDKKKKETIVSSSKNSKHSSADKLSSVEKKSFSSSESAKSGQKSRGIENPQFKKDENKSRTEQALLVNTKNVKRTLPKRQNINKASAKDNNHNVNTPTGRPQMKNTLDILRPKKLLLPSKKTASKPKSMIENRMSSPKKALELTESFSMPSVNPSPSEIHQYVENWLEKVNPDPVPYTEEAIMDESEPRTKVVFQIGDDSESDEKSKCQTNLNDYYPSPGDAVKKSSTCLSIPLCQEQPAAGLLHNEQYVRGLCVSMPSVRVDPVHQEDRPRSHKSIEAIGPADNESSLSTSNILSPRAKIKPVLRQLCSSIHCIRGTSDTNITSNIEKSNSLPDFQTQVASVFGSSCKAFLSFLSVMTLRDNITGLVPGDGNQSRSSSEAMLMMESLQKISSIDDEEEQRASLTDLQSRASSQFRERWKDFQTLRERLESEPLSPKVSETEFALDVVSEGGEVFDDQQLVIDELMEELNMPQDLRAQISSTIQQVKSFYPVEESTFVETEKNPSDSEEDVETFAEECSDETKQSPEPDATTMMTESDREHHEVQERGIKVKESKISQTDKDEPLTDNENEKEEEEQVEEVEEDWEEMYHREDGDTKEIHDDDDDDDEETKKGEREVEAEEVPVTKEKVDDEGQEEWEDERGSGEERILKGEKEEDEETEEGLMAVEDEEPREGDSVEETDERDCVEETEEEEKEEDGIDEETDKEEKEEEEGTEEKQGEEMEDEEDEVVEEKNEGEEVANMIEEVEEEKQEETHAVTEKDIEEGVIVKQDEEEETDEVIEENDKEANSQIQKRVKKDKTNKSEKKKKMIKPTRNQEGSTSTSSSDKKQKESISSSKSPSKNSKHSSTDRLSSNTSVGKKSLSSPESAKSGQKSRGVENPQFKKAIKDENTFKTEQALLGNTENVKRTLPKRQNINKASAKDNSHNVNTPTGRPQMKNTLDILRPKKLLLPSKKTASKPKSMIENRMSSPKKALELTESFSMPSVNPSPSEIHQYVENWLEKVNPDPVPYTEEAITDESEPRTKVVFQIGGDSESDEKSKCQTNLNDYYPSPGDAVKKSSTCLSIPLCQEQPAAGLLHNEQYVRGLCVSMPSVRVDPVHQEDRPRSHKSIEAIGPADNESSLSTSNILSPRAKIKPVLRELCSSIHCIRGTSDTNITSNIEKSNSLPDFQTQVASVFGSSCKAFLSFLSVMTLRDNITGLVPGDGNQSRSSSEAMLMMESLQKISAIDDKEEQRASLTDLQSRASSQFRERWKDFQTLRERLESEPLSPKVSETEFALDVVSEGGEVFDDQQLVINELMEELNMPQDLRAQISSTIQQVKSFYPVEESTLVQTERNQSDSEEDVETFADKDEPLTDNENEKEEEEHVEEVEKNWVGVNHREDGDTKEIDDDDGEETMKGETEEEAEEVPVTEEEMDDKGQEEWEEEGGSGEVNILKGEKEEVEETEEGSMDEEDEEPREGDSVEETDERVCVGETEEEEKEEDEVDEETAKKEKEEEDDAKTEVGEENNEEEEEGEQEEEHEERDGVVVGVKTDDAEEGDETDKIIEEKEKCGESEESWKVLEKTKNGLEEDSVEEVVEEIQIKENGKAGQMLDEEESEDDEENESHEGLDQVEEQKSNDELEEESVTNDADSKHLLEEASYLGQQSNCEEELNVGTNVAEHKTESSKCSSEGQCEDDKGNGTDSVNELETVDGGQHHEDRSISLPHPVEISQELLDFVNSALQSSSFIFTYDTQGNMRIEPDNARVVQTTQTVIPKSRNDSSYGLKRLPSPSTSDLSDYRPETSESDGYKTQESVDIVTESGEEASGRPSPAHSTDIPNGRTNEERANSKLSVGSISEVLQNSRLKSGGTSCDSGAKASREDLSYFSAASSQKADGEAPLEATQCISFSSEKDSTDGVLIDQGRWLLKENHLIRRSPPVSLGMYDNVDSTSVDTGEENTSVDSPSHYKSQYNPLAAISSSELEEMAKPQTPKCTYYNMPHGSDSDPFLDDSSVKSGKKDSAVVKGKGFRVSPTIDTSKTSINKNGSLSSFASVEFKIPDRKVHPEGESSVVTQAGRTSSGGGTELQAQDSLDTLQVRCGQYCPIL